MVDKQSKNFRTLDMYARLCEGKVLNKAEEAQRFGVDERSIQRDIDDIRAFLAEKTISSDGESRTIEYSRKEKGYVLAGTEGTLMNNPEILAVSKILLASRAFPKDDIEIMLNKLISGCVPPKNKSLVTELIRNEEFHYVEPRHQTSCQDIMWEIGQAIHNHQYIEIRYQGIQGSTVKTRKLKPLAIMFSEYYFYLAAFIDDEKVRENFNVLNDSFPTIYRIDRIQSLNVLKEKYHVPYRDRFEEGEFRKRIQFMYGGKLRRVRFKYTGYSVEAVLDRLPTAIIESQGNGEYIISAEVFGNGIDMWFRSQGEQVEVLI